MSGRQRSRWRKKFIADGIIKQGGKCFWCEVRMTIHIGPITPENPIARTAATLDHLFPKTDPRRKLYEGQDGTIIIACHWCNHRRKDKKPEVFAEQILMERKRRDAKSQAREAANRTRSVPELPGDSSGHTG